MKALVMPAPIPREAPVTIAVPSLGCVPASIVAGSLTSFLSLSLFQHSVIPFQTQPGCCSSVADTFVSGKPCASNPPSPVASNIRVHLATACGVSQKVGEIPKVFDSHGHQRERKNNRLDHLYVANKLTFVAQTPNDRIMTVVRVNSDQIDKVGVAAHQSFSFRTRSNSRFRVPWRLLSHPCRPAVRDPRLAPQIAVLPRSVKPPQAHPPLPLSLGLALFDLERLGSSRFHHPARYGDWLPT